MFDLVGLLDRWFRGLRYEEKNTRDRHKCNIIWEATGAFRLLFNYSPLLISPFFCFQVRPRLDGTIGRSNLYIGKISTCPRYVLTLRCDVWTCSGWFKEPIILLFELVYLRSTLILSVLSIRQY